MDEQDLTKLLERAAASTSIKTPPLDDIISQGQNLPTRRRPLLLVGVVAATTLTVLGVVVAQQTMGDRQSNEAPLASPSGSATQRPLAPAGMRLVGMGRVVVAVPEEWATEIGGCYDLPLQNRVYFPSKFNVTCAGERPPNTSSVAFYDSRSQSVTGLVNETDVRAEVNGISVLRAPLEPGNAEDVVQGVMVVPSEHLLIWVDAPGAEAVNKILNSVTTLPEGYVAIPSAEGTLEATREAMVQAGLQVSVTRTEILRNGDRVGEIANTVPALGSVVEEGSPVTIVVAGGTG